MPDPLDQIIFVYNVRCVHSLVSSLGLTTFSKCTNLLEFPGSLVVKDLALSLLWLGSQLWQEFDPWPLNFCMLWVWPKKGSNLTSTVI